MRPVAITTSRAPLLSSASDLPGEANERPAALLQKVPYYTTLAVTKAIAAQRADKLDVKPLQEYG